jgi:hypothetical protein
MVVVKLCAVDVKLFGPFHAKVLLAGLAVALIVAVGSAQVKVLLTKAVTVGTTVFDWTIVDATALQPFPLVTVTEYGPLALTEINGVIAPVLH